MVDDQAFNTFIGTFKEFQGRMRKFEETTEQWQKDTNIRLTNIEHSVANPKVCPSHETVLTMIGNMKESGRKEAERGLATNVRQTESEKDIRDLQEEDRYITFKLNKTQAAQLTITTIVSSTLALITIVKALMGLP